MLLNKLKHLALLVALVTIVGSGTLWQARNFTWADDRPAQTAPAPAKVPQPLSPGHILYSCDSYLYLMDPNGPGVLKPLAGIPKDAEVPACAWAPDGKHIACVIGTVHWLAPTALKKFESRLIVADVDGGNAKVVRSEKGKMLIGVDWR